MKIVTNEPLIKRNRKIGQYTTLGSLVILAGGLYLSFQTNSTLIFLSLAALIVGFALSQIGIYFGNRWGKSPRPDEVIADSLKGLDDKYTLYNYSTPVSHLLLGPSGAWVLIPYTQAGTVTYTKGRWRQKGGNFYLKIFAQDSIGRPDYEVETQIEKVKKVLAANLGEEELPVIHPALIFTNEKVTIQADEAPVPTLKADKLKDFIRKKSRETPFAPEKLDALRDSLAKA
jgi:hypothetical protein